ncbi:hypothetical protein FJ527_04775 [Mesorhizobium sp. B2-4-18]|uniref:hypothetical protein n=1 Tax=Mesorhizobium sp. B2-4-18 TaxID=2589931 RepID=UPI00112A44F3|nr:hypothetical protein [Mesorhizobium sp. B2-4-18]TPK79436.1 hypothetical protein FJ527_04775 [Mesorhizobium sp. B2-4-18]
MEFAERGDRYIQRQTITDGDGRTHEFYDIGTVIIMKDGTKRYKPSAEAGFDTREKAVEWLNEEQP